MRCQRTRTCRRPPGCNVGSWRGRSRRRSGRPKIHKTGSAAAWSWSPVEAEGSDRHNHRHSPGRWRHRFRRPTAVAAQSWRHGSRSASVPQPITHERMPAVTPRAHSPSSTAHAPRQAAASLPVGASATGVGGVQLPRQDWRSSRHDPVTLPRNASAQPRMQPPRSAGTAFVRQSVRQASFTRRAVLMHAAFDCPQPASHCRSCARAAGSARNVETPSTNATA